MCADPIFLNYGYYANVYHVAICNDDLSNTLGKTVDPLIVKLADGRIFDHKSSLLDFIILLVEKVEAEILIDVQFEIHIVQMRAFFAEIDIENDLGRLTANVCDYGGRSLAYCRNKSFFIHRNNLFVRAAELNRSAVREICYTDDRLCLLLC